MYGEWFDVERFFFALVASWVFSFFVNLCLNLDFDVIFVLFWGFICFYGMNKGLICLYWKIKIIVALWKIKIIETFVFKFGPTVIILVKVPYSR